MRSVGMRCVLRVLRAPVRRPLPGACQRSSGSSGSGGRLGRPPPARGPPQMAFAVRMGGQWRRAGRPAAEVAAGRRHHGRAGPVPAGRTP
ncbi:hypothetical protein AAHZ94_34845, partial [Streptomyces sp. HSW2009]|uniref:hypothetical protein n=1 Tax=Streptomyces sp. HSW2009 TaxID=3142890 RepID=UPI0032F0109C